MWFKDGGIRLRALEPEDLEWLYPLENDETLWAWGASNVPYSRYSLKEYVAGSRHDLYADGQLRLAAVWEPDGQVCGCVDLVDFSPRHQRAEVGIVVFPAYRRRGIARRVLGMMADYARDHLFLHQLYAIVSQRNTAALRLFEQAGYRRMAELDDWLRDGNDRYVGAAVFGLRL